MRTGTNPQLNPLTLFRILPQHHQLHPMALGELSTMTFNKQIPWTDAKIRHPNCPLYQASLGKSWEEYITVCSKFSKIRFENEAVLGILRARVSSGPFAPFHACLNSQPTSDSDQLELKMPPPPIQSQGFCSTLFIRLLPVTITH